MDKIEVFINGKKELEKEVEFVSGKELIRTFEMILDYARLHKGSKIKMLKGLKGLK